MTLIAPLVCVLALAAEPEPTPASPQAGEAASYEDERLALALAAAKLHLDPAPDGKRIGTIHIVRDDVFAEDEPFPTFLNVFHARTHEDVVARELLFEPGETWDPERVEESMRNLREQTIFALVRIVPVAPDHAASPHPETVDVLVYTRDLWSLRIESGFSLTDGFLDHLALTLIERNVAGRNVQAAISFELEPRTFSLGELFVDRRLFGSRWALSQAFDVVFERDSGAPEGTLGSLVVGLPLWDLRPRWGVELAAAWNVSVGRQLSGRTLLTWDDEATVDTEEVPRIWEQSLAKVTLSALRQTGEGRHKWRYAWGFGAYVTDFAPHADTGLAARDPQYDRFVDDVLPRAREEIYPYVRVDTFDARWARFVDLGAYGLSEDVRVGPWASLFFAAPLEAFGSADDALVWDVSAGFVAAPPSPWGRGDGLIDLTLAHSARLEQGEVIDQTYRLRARAASPPFLLGRLVASLSLSIRGKDVDRTLVTLGGDAGLRGYGSQAFFGFGADRLQTSVELRTPPAVLGSIHFGGVLFYDAGAVGDIADGSNDDFELHHAVGLGLRVMMPQLNRFVFRFDVGAPLDGGHFTVLLNVGTSQAVPMTAIEDQRLAR
ncbi:MAG: BamA/TamA family outer membrane protein [Deltaproteobacteria bacterium]|nr:BamA/TamA family outer membrane protein [Deltaproteobacteria bacterium]